MSTAKDALFEEMEKNLERDTAFAEAMEGIDFDDFTVSVDTLNRGDNLVLMYGAFPVNDPYRPTPDAPWYPGPGVQPVDIKPFLDEIRRLNEKVAELEKALAAANEKRKEEGLPPVYPGVPKTDQLELCVQGPK